MRRRATASSSATRTRIIRGGASERVEGTWLNAVRWQTPRHVVGDETYSSRYERAAASRRERHREQDRRGEPSAWFPNAVVAELFPLAVGDVHECSTDDGAAGWLVGHGAVSVQDFGPLDAPS